MVLFATVDQIGLCSSHGVGSVFGAVQAQLLNPISVHWARKRDWLRERRGKSERIGLIIERRAHSMHYFFGVFSSPGPRLRVPGGLIQAENVVLSPARVGKEDRASRKGLRGVCEQARRSEVALERRVPRHRWTKDG